MRSDSSAELASVRGLKIGVLPRPDTRRIVHDASFTILAGEIVGLVGESGSGKTTVGTALLGFTRAGASIYEGRIEIQGTNILAVSTRQQRAFRGEVVSFVPQNPLTALNPGLRIGDQIYETLDAHAKGAGDKASEVGKLLEQVGLPPTSEFQRRLPHQLSGGQQQRVCIAIAFACNPRLVVLDEPTTGLDVTTQATILELLRDVCLRRGVGALYVTHDLGVVRHIADRIMVMYAGRIVECGLTEAVFSAPKHHYTAALIASVPSIRQETLPKAIPGRPPPLGRDDDHCAFSPRCPAVTEVCRTSRPVLGSEEGHVAACFHSDRVRMSGNRAEARAPSVRGEPVLSVSRLSIEYGNLRAVQDIAFQVAQGECLAVVGESGSGKSTTARAIVGLKPWASGEVTLDGLSLARRVKDRTQEQRLALQYIFQDPVSSLNPRLRISESLMLTLKYAVGETLRTKLRMLAAEALDRVSLGQQLLDRYPADLSGGEKQRVSIARALLCRPRVLICDEVTTALDVSAQASIITLLRELQATTGVTLVLITHNLALARSMAQQTIVLQHGRVIEQGSTSGIVDSPRQPYTISLMRATGAVDIRGKAHV